MLIRSMGVEKEEPNVKKSLRSFFFMNLSMPVYSNTFYVPYKTSMVMLSNLFKFHIFSVPEVGSR